MLVFRRTLRTASSERFLIFKDGKEAGAIDLHYLESRTVAGTVTLLRHADWTEDSVPDLLAAFDEDMLPDVDVTQGNLTYTVVMGEVLGSYEAEAAEPAR